VTRYIRGASGARGTLSHVSVKFWEPTPSGSDHPTAARIHLFNNSSSSEKMAFSRTSFVVGPGIFNSYDETKQFESIFWAQLLNDARRRPLRIIEIPPQVDTTIDAGPPLPDDLPDKVRAGTFIPVFAIVGRNKLGDVVLEACAYLSNGTAGVRLCLGHNTTR
jgi:hypothetical protein